MKRLIFISLTFLVCFSSCDSNENDCDPKKVTSMVSAEKEIHVEFYEEFERNIYTIIDGDKLVFQYNHTGAQCDKIMDDEWGEALFFQVENDSENFEFANDEILLTKCYYSQYGAWTGGLQYPIETGTIKGEKISEKKWEVTVDVETTPLFEHEAPRHIKFTRVFSK